MKKIIPLLIACTTFYNLSAQVSNIPSEKLMTQFTGLYKELSKKLTFFQRFSDAATLFFSTNNQVLEESLIDLSDKYKVSVDSAASILLDSIMRAFIQGPAWDDYIGNREKDKPFLEFYNNKTRSCLNDKLRRIPAYSQIDKHIAGCTVDFLKDTTCMDSTRRLLSDVAMHNLYDRLLSATPYLYQHCDSLYNHSLASCKATIYIFLLARQRSFYAVDETIIGLYKNKSNKLAGIFPSYKKYQSVLRSAGAVAGQPQMLYVAEKTVNTEGRAVVNKIYYRYEGEKIILLARVISVLTKDSPQAPLLSMEYIPADKISDPNKYLLMINPDYVPEQSKTAQ